MDFSILGGGWDGGLHDRKRGTRILQQMKNLGGFFPGGGLGGCGGNKLTIYPPPHPFDNDMTKKERFIFHLGAIEKGSMDAKVRKHGYLEFTCDGANQRCWPQSLHLLFHVPGNRFSKAWRESDFCPPPLFCWGGGGATIYFLQKI